MAGHARKVKKKNRGPAHVPVFVARVALPSTSAQDVAPNDVQPELR